MPPITQLVSQSRGSDSSTYMPREYAFIKRRVKELTAIDLSNYKTRQMQRRLKALIARSGFSSWKEYLRYLTINVSRFFRDTKKWTYLANRVMPALLKERHRLRIWSAGCSHGAEAYTLAIILDELQRGVAGHYILATDIDSAMLSKARQGGPYSREDIEDLNKIRLLKYLEKRDGAYWVPPSLRSKVKFRHHDLLNDPFERSFDLIVCRNVVIYFIDETKKELYSRFAASLRKGGILFVGGTEIIPTIPGLPLHSMAISFYRRGEQA